LTPPVPYEGAGGAAFREIPSYLIRRGRTGVTSHEAHQRLWPVYGLEPPYAPWSDQPLVLEIGFGMGEATALMAAADPGTDLLAVDVHPAGVMALLRRIETAGLTNVRVVEGDAVEVLRALPDASLAGLRVYFPDPWPKARHAKRRLLRPSFAALAASRLAPGATLHLATDWPEYVEHALLALQGWDARVIDRPGWRPATGYERRALRDGRSAVDLLCTPPAP
jgi:tRNA (guanine-N7-)-methyltransferase